MNTVIWRDGAGKHGAVRRKGYGAWGNHIFEKDALLRELVNVRRGLTGVTVAAQIVSPAGVDTDKDDIANLVCRNS